jgi:hypothetical protein
VAFKDIKRALVVLPPPAASDQPIDYFKRNYGQLAQQVTLIQNSIQRFSVAVGAGLGNVTATLPVPYPDNDYGVWATPVGVTNPWNTTVYIAAPADITATTVKFTFGTVAPAGGGTLLVLTLR